jgi:uncharacterized protein involved in outer membrane biogenesis
MTPVKKRWTIIALLAALACGGYFAAVKLTPKYLGPDRISEIITQSFKDKLNRRVSFTGVSYAHNQLVVDNLEVKDRADFGGGDFFKARKLVCEIAYTDLRGRKLAIRELRLEQPEIYLRRKTSGGWNFADLPETFSKPTKLPLEWSIGSYSVMGGKIQIEDEAGQDFLSLSTCTASFAMSTLPKPEMNVGIRGSLGGFYKGDSVASDMRLDTDVAMENGKPDDISATFALKSLVWQNIILGALDGKVSVKNATAKPADRSFDVSLSLKDFMLDKIKERAAAGGWEKGLVDGVGMYAKVRGVAVPDMASFYFDEGSFAISQSSMTWTLDSFTLHGKNANLDIKSKLDAAQSVTDSSFSINIGDVKFDFAAQGPMSGPQYKPQMSSTVQDGLNRLFSLIEKSLANYYS